VIRSGEKQEIIREEIQRDLPVLNAKSSGKRKGGVARERSTKGGGDTKREPRRECLHSASAHRPRLKTHTPTTKKDMGKIEKRGTQSRGRLFLSPFSPSLGRGEGVGKGRRKLEDFSGERWKRKSASGSTTPILSKTSYKRKTTQRGPPPPKTTNGNFGGTETRKQLGHRRSVFIFNKKERFGGPFSWGKAGLGGLLRENRAKSLMVNGLSILLGLARGKSFHRGCLKLLGGTREQNACVTHRGPEHGKD